MPINDAMILLRIARDEAQTLVDYQTMLDEAKEVDEDTRAAVDEIMGDEFNHCLIALLLAREKLGIKIATDDISEDPNKIEVE